MDIQSLPIGKVSLLFLCVSAEEITCVFDDNSKIIFVEAILMSTHNIGFYEEISKIIT